MCTVRLGVSLATLCLGIQAQSLSSVQLAGVKKVCVDKFAGDDQSTVHAREVAIASMFTLKRFAITENCNKADAILKGAVTEKEDQRTRSEGESAGMATHSGVGRASRNAAAIATGGMAVHSDEALSSSETRR